MKNKDITVVMFGKGKRPHEIHNAWVEALGIDKFVHHTLIEMRNIFPKLSALNHLFAYCKSLFVPKSKIYFLTSLGALPAVVLNKKLYGSKVISINSDTFLTILNESKGLKKKYLTWLLKHVDAVISTSEWVGNLAAGHCNAVQEIVYPFCKIDNFCKLDSNWQSPDIGCIGLAIKTKGTDILIDAFNKYNEKFPESKIYLCGKPGPVEHLKKPKNSIMPGWVNPPEFLSKMGIYVNASRHESFGVNILEAMCSGKALVVTNHCGAAELIRQVDPSLVVDPDSNAIAEAMIKLQSDLKRKKELCVKLRNLGLKYTKERSVKEFKKKFDSILEALKC